MSLGSVCGPCGPRLAGSVVQVYSPMFQFQVDPGQDRLPWCGASHSSPLSSLPVLPAAAEQDEGPEPSDSLDGTGECWGSVRGGGGAVQGTTHRVSQLLPPSGESESSDQQTVTTTLPRSVEMFMPWMTRP